MEPCWSWVTSDQLFQTILQSKTLKLVCIQVSGKRDNGTFESRVHSYLGQDFLRVTSDAHRTYLVYFWIFCFQIKLQTFWKMQRMKICFLTNTRIILTTTMIINSFLSCLGISIAVIYFWIVITTCNRKIELFIMIRCGILYERYLYLLLYINCIMI